MLLALSAQFGQSGMEIFAFLPMLLGLATWVVILIVIWRTMKAHESIAESLRAIAMKEQ
ncbi:MAG: hypothetical protein IH892_06390 [Planctomycetes bacterium]|nr:hypothetical protein [Planctomycetota bacterium]